MANYMVNTPPPINVTLADAATPAHLDLRQPPLRDYAGGYVGGDAVPHATLQKTDGILFKPIQFSLTGGQAITLDQANNGRTYLLVTANPNNPGAIYVGFFVFDMPTGGALGSNVPSNVLAIPNGGFFEAYYKIPYSAICVINPNSGLTCSGTLMVA